MKIFLETWPNGERLAGLLIEKLAGLPRRLAGLPFSPPDNSIRRKELGYETAHRTRFVYTDFRSVPSLIGNRHHRGTRPVDLRYRSIESSTLPVVVLTTAIDIDGRLTAAFSGYAKRQNRTLEQGRFL